MKSLFHFDFHANCMTETNHTTWTIKKTCQCHSCHHYQNIPAIQETYIQYMQNYWLLEAFCMSHHCQLWLTCPFRHQSDSHLSDDDGAAWENVLHENLTGKKKQKVQRERERKVITIIFESFLLKVELLCPFSPSYPFLSPVSLPFPSFPCQSHWVAQISFLKLLLITVIGNCLKHTILPLNSLQSHLPPTFSCPGCLCSSSPAQCVTHLQLQNRPHCLQGAVLDKEGTPPGKPAEELRNTYPWRKATFYQCRSTYWVPVLQEQSASIHKPVTEPRENFLCNCKARKADLWGWQMCLITFLCIPSG